MYGTFFRPGPTLPSCTRLGLGWSIQGLTLIGGDEVDADDEGEPEELAGLGLDDELGLTRDDDGALGDSLGEDCGRTAEPEGDAFEASCDSAAVLKRACRMLGSRNSSSRFGHRNAASTPSNTTATASGNAQRSHAGYCGTSDIPG
jgi:hypothetical protein